MLNAYPVHDATSRETDDLADSFWIDLHSPEPGEIARVETAIGASLPSLSALREIAASSRLRFQDSESAQPKIGARSLAKSAA